MEFLRQCLQFTILCLLTTLNNIFVCNGHQEVEKKMKKKEKKRKGKEKDD